MKVGMFSVPENALIKLGHNRIEVECKTDVIVSVNGMRNGQAEEIDLSYAHQSDVLFHRLDIKLASSGKRIVIYPEIGNESCLIIERFDAVGKNTEYLTKNGRTWKKKPKSPHLPQDALRIRLLDGS